MSLESKAGAVKSFAIGAGILIAIAAAVYLIVKARQGVEKVAQGTGFAFGTSNDESLGSWLYDAVHGAVPPVDALDPQDPQVLRTCQALYPEGSGKLPAPGSVCEIALRG